MSLKPSIRIIWLFSLGLTMMALGSAYYLMWHFHVLACLWCILEQSLLIGMALLSLWVVLIGYQHTLRWQVGYRYVALSMATVGCLMTAWHVFTVVYRSPTSGASCTADIGYLMRYMPVRSVLEQLASGLPSCTEATWPVWGIPLPAWACAVFFSLFCLFVYASKSFGSR